MSVHMPAEHVPAAGQNMLNSLEPSSCWAPWMGPSLWLLPSVSGTLHWHPAC